MFERKYEIVPNAPAHTSWDDYSKISLKEYRNLLETASDDETAFQHFFEENPSFVPGAFELFGSSGHYPYTQSLITSQNLMGVFSIAFQILSGSHKIVYHLPLF